jgi:predicted O-methyltransferase YrrM
MRPERRALLEELAAYGSEHDAALSDRLLRLRNVETETARMLSVLMRACATRRALELGTSNGYSTLWLGDAAESIGGALVSVDVDAERTAMATQTIARAGLAQVVELRTEDAGESLAAHASDAVDFIFLDAERPAYVDYWQDLVRVLAIPGLLVVDNAISHERELVEFTALAEHDSRVASALVPIGAGVLLIARTG